ncbi:unnamed protein product [Sympodiomycopsis kandeliae]
MGLVSPIVNPDSSQTFSATQQTVDVRKSNWMNKYRDSKTNKEYRQEERVSRDGGHAEGKEGAWDLRGRG